MSKRPYRDHEEATIESFQNDPRFAAEYLNAALEGWRPTGIDDRATISGEGLRRGVEARGASGAERDHALTARCHGKTTPSEEPHGTFEGDGDATGGAAHRSRQSGLRRNIG